MSEPEDHRALPPILCLTGIDGCGKSTHLSRLARRLERHKKLRADVLTVWSITRNAHYQNHPFISDRTAIHRYLATLHGGARMLFIAHALMESLDLLTDERVQVVLADGYWYKYLCSERLHGLSLDWLLRTVACLPAPRRTILLDLPPEKAWERKSDVTPYECGMARPCEAAFVTFQSRLRRELRELADAQGWPVIDVDRPEEEVADELWNLIKHEV